MMYSYQWGEVVNQTKVMTEGAILVALFSVFLLAAIYLPVIGMFFMFTLAIPFIVFTYRHGFKRAILIFVVALLITYITAGILTTPLTVMFGVSGMIMGHFYRNQSPAFTVLIAGSLSFLANLVMFYGIAMVFLQIDIAEQTQKMLTESFSMAENFITSTGGEPSDQLDSLYKQLEALPYMIPSFLVLIGIFLAVFTQFFGNLVLKRLKGKIQSFPPFRDWQFPKSLLWYYLAVMVFTFFQLEVGSTLYMIVINAFVVLDTIMVVQGLIFIFYFSHMKGLSKAIPITITVLTFLLPIFLSLIKILGIIDLGFDLRKRLKK
jgi:uncharacterized protein YybS (DUF2232 family)